MSRNASRIGVSPCCVPDVVVETVATARGTRSGRWQARTTGATLLPGGPWATRQRAVDALALDYQHQVKVRRRRGR